jgi:DNA uptake protein ComE-like DNA-binding protein
MRRILQGIIVALAAFGLAAGSAIAQKAEPSKDAAKKSDAAAKDATKKAAAPAAAPAKADAMDINSASEKELATLKGIGDVRAKAIVKGRPYKGKDELVQKKIVPQNVYDDIKDQIIAKQDAAPAKAAAKAEPMKEAAPKKDEKKK